MNLEKPILFNTEMVKAILDGRKIMTRRVVRTHIVDRFVLDPSGKLLGSFTEEEGDVYPTVDDSYYQSGDILWVRETFWQSGKWAQAYPEDDEWSAWIGQKRYHYQADGDPPNEPNNGYPEGLRNGKYSAADPARVWRKFPSIHMPRKAARLFLRVTNVRVERLQDIGLGDCYAEGCPEEYERMPKEWFKTIWESTIKKQDFDKYGWDANPWVWVIEFERVEV